MIMTKSTFSDMLLISLEVRNPNPNLGECWFQIYASYQKFLVINAEGR